MGDPRVEGKLWGLLKGGAVANPGSFGTREVTAGIQKAGTHTYMEAVAYLEGVGPLTASQQEGSPGR